MKICRSEWDEERWARRIIRVLLAAMAIGLIVMIWVCEKRRVDQVIEHRINVTK